MGDQPGLSELERFLSEFEPDHVDIALELRDLVLSVLDEPEERIYRGWRGLGYLTATGYLGGIFFAEHGVRLGFEQGTRLADPEGSLTGTGSRVRYLEIPDWTPEIAAVAELFLRQANQLD